MLLLLLDPVCSWWQSCYSVPFLGFRLSSSLHSEDPVIDCVYIVQSIIELQAESKVVKNRHLTPLSTYREVNVVKQFPLRKPS